MHYWKISVGFLIASLVQAAIIIGSEAVGISDLGAELTLGQLVNHILAGQAAGFLLMVIMQSLQVIQELTFWLSGFTYGSLVWVLLIPINVAQGTIKAPWEQGFMTLVITLLAFVVYGIISAYTIKRYSDETILS